MNSAIIGLGFGDEGKGLATDYLCSLLQDRSTIINPLVVRFSGGHQAGHTVYHNGMPHIFSNFGSGTLRCVPTYWSKFCTIEPIGFLKEYNTLKSKGVTPKIYIDERCPITTPYDIIANNKDRKDIRNGSCGVGYGKTLEREENFYSLTALDMWYPSILREKFRLIRDYYGWYDTEIEKTFLDSCEKMCYFIESAFDVPKNYERLIFEGSQGLLLDQHYGFFPNVTRTNTGTTNIKELTKDSFKTLLITRAYQTRHGNGFMTNRKEHVLNVHNPFESNIRNPYQGEFRTSVLDISLLEYAIKKSNIDIQNTWLFITCLDIVKGWYRYTYKGKLYTPNNEDYFVKEISDILCIRNVLGSYGPSAKDVKVLKEV